MDDAAKITHTIVRDLLFDTDADNVVSKIQNIEFLYRNMKINKRDDSIHIGEYDSIKRLYAKYFHKDKTDEVDNSKLVNKVIKFAAHFYNLFSKNFIDEENNNLFFYDETGKEDFERIKDDFLEAPLGLDETDLKPTNTNEVLLIIGCLTKEPNIDIDSEARMIEKCISSTNKQVSIVKYISVYDEFISKAIDFYKPKYLHFIGHSDPNSIYVFDKFERERAISYNEFNNVFRNKFELLFLNSCFSIEYLKNMSSKNYVYSLGYTNKISDFIAKYIAVIFYSYYFNNKKFKDSYHLTCKNILNEINSKGKIVHKYGEKQCKPGEIVQKHLDDLAEKLYKYLELFKCN